MVAEGSPLIGSDDVTVTRDALRLDHDVIAVRPYGDVRTSLLAGAHRIDCRLRLGLTGRIEEPDLVYRTEREKYEAIVKDIIDRQAEGRPVLVGTVSIEKSEKLSSRLKRRGIKHVVLNAKYHEREAEIVAQAGRKGSVTIATNMAGRGTDILLGGNPDFMAREFLKKEEIDPDDATEEQWATLREADRLEELEPVTTVSADESGVVRLTTTLPMPSMSLLTFTPAG